MNDINKLAKQIFTLRDEIGKIDIPASWLEFFLLVASEGEHGVTTKEVTERVKCTQGIASRMVKLMSRYYNQKTLESDGLDLLVTIPDHVHRHRQRVFLSENGKRILAKVTAIK